MSRHPASAAGGDGGVGGVGGLGAEPIKSTKSTNSTKSWGWRRWWSWWSLRGPPPIHHPTNSITSTGLPPEPRTKLPKLHQLCPGLAEVAELVEAVSVKEPR